MNPKRDSFPFREESFFASLRHVRVNLGVRIALSIATGLIFTALANFGGWLLAVIAPNAFGNYPRSFFRVSDEHLLIAYSICAALWLLALRWVWRGTRVGSIPVWPILLTLVVWILVIPILMVTERMMRPEAEYLMAAEVLIGFAFTVLIWTPLINRFRRHMPVLGEEDIVNVFCPKCGYCLVGLRELRCPECGTEFTVDELIRSQGYRTESVESANNGGASSESKRDEGRKIAEDSGNL